MKPVTQNPRTAIPGIGTGMFEGLQLATCLSFTKGQGQFNTAEGLMQYAANGRAANQARVVCKVTVALHNTVRKHGVTPIS